MRLLLPIVETYCGGLRPVEYGVRDRGFWKTKGVRVAYPDELSTRERAPVGISYTIPLLTTSRIMQFFHLFKIEGSATRMKQM